MRISSHNKGGFSLIELMVALSIFSIVMTVSIGTLIVLIDANGKAQALTSAMTNISFAADSVTRNLRTGRDFYCGSATSIVNGLGLQGGRNDCPNGNEGIVFTPGSEPEWRMAYRLNDTVIEQRIDTDTTSGSWVPITSDEPPAAVDVEVFRVIVTGSDNYLDDDDEEQPRIVLLIAGSVGNGLESSTDFQIQSNVTQRVLDY